MNAVASTNGDDQFPAQETTKPNYKRHKLNKLKLESNLNNAKWFKKPYDTQNLYWNG